MKWKAHPEDGKSYSSAKEVRRDFLGDSVLNLLELEII